MTLRRGVSSAAGLTLMAALTSCGDVPKPADTGLRPPPVKDLAQVVELPKFERASYAALDGKSSIALVSPNELELTRDGKTYSCQYTREASRIRAVIEAAGTKTVEYFNDGADGLTADNGTRYYAPGTLEIARLQARGDELKRQQQELEAKINANKSTDADFMRKQADELRRIKAELAEKIEQEKKAAAAHAQAQAIALAQAQAQRQRDAQALASQAFPGQPRGASLPAVDYVLQAEECVGNNDRAGAIKFYDIAISLTENDGNPVQARIFAARKSAIERGKR